MGKAKTEIKVTAFFDGEMDATDAFVCLIAERYGQEPVQKCRVIPNEYLAGRRKGQYNGGKVHVSQLPPGLCG